MKFGVSTWLWVSPFKTELADGLFKKISEMGFDAVELALEDPSVVDKQAVLDASEKYQLNIIVCGAFGPTRDLTHENPAIHQQCFDYIETCLDLCVAWNSPLFAGPMYSAVGKARMLPPDQRKREWDLAVKNLYTVCGMAAERKIQIALEPLNRFESDLVNTVDDLDRLINDIGHPYAKMMLDSFHMNIEERDVRAAIHKAGERLIHFQVSENYRGIPGTGTSPWNDYFSALQDINYQGTVSIESFTPQNQELAGAVCIWKPLADNQDEFAKQGLAFLKQGLKG